ncbi:putative oligomerization/nucleic acid binding protein [Hoeflea halophila]|uniref:Putative oligomerization/nucleic acid binding protein n=1 Tax=Hoeflea halophila TaxID=714899 RepID=A0A286IEY6_9HYPH|nr:SHOCT domain-containing protein [Hoeflea halophila]SOE18695.1 putative oligomerization/nucleic acid binding protein [Hoeflea halophila]
MTQLTEEGRKALADIAARHGVSEDGVEHLLMALIAGQGTQAQFNHPELGGMGQWSQGGMTMVGDMFNNALKAKVDALCTDVAQSMRQSALLDVSSAPASQSQYQGDGASLSVGGATPGNWWPAGLGHAASNGAQNQMRYAWFPDTARLAIDTGDGKVRVYDTADHRIGGFSQQQSADQSLSFTSQYGLVKLSDLREIDLEQPGDAGTGAVNGKSGPALSEALLKAASETRPAAPSLSAAGPAPDSIEPLQPKATTQDPLRLDEAEAKTEAASGAVDEFDIFAKIERLASLHARGILSDEEFQSKKAELLARI